MTVAALLLATAGAAAAPAIDPASLRPLGRVSERFQSYNVEMVEVTGGRFWKPYRFGPPASETDRYRYRPPVDLSSPKLRMLARALGPAYLRVSGTWANTTWFQTDTSVEKPPPGFSAVLTRAQWKGVVAFSRAVGAPIVTSFAGSPGVRDATGAWTPGQMEALVAFTKKQGGVIAGAEFLNEPNLVSLTGAPAGYDASAYARDWDRFASAFRRAAPGALLLGPGSVGEGGTLEALAAAAKIRLAASSDMLAAATAKPDVVSYHHYAAMSERCGKGTPLSTSLEQAMSPAVFDRTLRTLSLYRGLRDRFAPDAPIWLTETGQAACGGDRWSSTFADTPRYVDQLGLLARQGVSVVMHNTLAASDYALIDEETLEPRPSYWAALLWRRLMGTTVLDVQSAGKLRIYAHCLRGIPGGVAMAVVNTGAAALFSAGKAAGQTLTLTASGESGAALNGRTLALIKGRLPSLGGAPIRDGIIKAPAASVTFLTFREAGNQACLAAY
jgi:hypothetical protein